MDVPIHWFQPTNTHSPKTHGTTSKNKEEKMNIPVREGIQNCLERLNHNSGESRIVRDMGISSTSTFHIVADYGDVKFVEQDKNNGTKTLAYIFKSGRSDIWFAVIPTANQVEVLATKLKPHFDDLNKRNNEALERDELK
jgi:hypothetical protein